LEESSELNFIKWDHFAQEKNSRGGRGGNGGFGFGRKGENFEVSVEVVKDYVINRFKSLTRLIDNAALSAK
jgi:hypothetical protein